MAVRNGLSSIFMRRTALRFREKSLSRNREQGSITILTIGLFLLAILMLILITDIASIAVAKRSLLHATEAAAIRATHSLDLKAYYQGIGGADIPLDCQKAYREVVDELNQWMSSGSDMKRGELGQFQLMDFSCARNHVEISTSAQAQLPFKLPNSSFSYFEINATVSAESDRKG